jgi:DNA-binding transcriptional regulator YhcF (GntR family)
MEWKFAQDRPIYAQIVERIQKGILAGVYPPGSAMPSVRTLAIEAGVNPNTMQKALAELEAQGLLHTQRTSGRRVSEDERLIVELREKLARELAGQYLESMQALGFAPREAARIIEDAAGSKRAPAKVESEVNK